MTAKVQKWGNSLGIRIPSHVAKSMSLHQGSEVEMMVDDEQLTLRPKPKKPTLDELLSQCTPENRHKEINFGSAGKEML